MLDEVLQISRDLAQSDHTIVRGLGTLATAVEKLLDAKPALAPLTLADVFGIPAPSAASGSESTKDKVISALVEARDRQAREKAGKHAFPNLRSEGEDSH
jgi:hypothetical protein